MAGLLFKRKVYDKLAEWRKLSRGSSAALIEGARRVGKSTVAEEFAKNEYGDYLLLDFAVESDDVRDNFANIGNLNAFFRNLFLIKGKELPRNDAVIIFDEVQLFPPARQAIKQLVKDGRYDYIETGSLISIRENVKDILIPSEEHRIEMHPMDFEEFLWATGNAVAAPAIRQAFEDGVALPDSVHRRMMQDFRTYIAVGGLPQAVASFVRGETFAQIDFVKRAIISLYEGDLHKHDERARDRAVAAFRSIPSQLTHKNSRFQYASVGKSANAKRLQGAVDFLRESMMVNVCYNVSDPQINLELFRDETAIKMFMGDTGLLITQITASNAQTDDSLYRGLITGSLGINEGMVMENAVAQALVANGHALYFHEYEFAPPDTGKLKRYEVDFLLVRGRRLSPIEVKSSGYKSHKSFDYFTQRYDVKVNKRFILYAKNLVREGNLTFLPFYMAMCL